MNAIPTTYKSIRFRSRLEAKWARFFDAFAWKWLYEPLDLNGYIPDFIVPFTRGDLLIEVKPLTRFSRSAIEPIQAKIKQSGWTGRHLIVGCAPNLDSDDFYEKWWDELETLGILADYFGPDDLGSDQCHVFLCPHCSSLDCWSNDNYWQCHACGRHVEKAWNHAAAQFTDLFAVAQNETQWNPA
jgi:hypothetical protein